MHPIGNSPTRLIRVRRSVFKPQALTRHYAAGRSALMSHVLTALSITFPTGEQFFVHSVRNVRNRVTDERLQADISAFIGQEAMHSQAHAQFNQALDATDYPLHRYEASVADGMQQLKARSVRRQLAATVAYEHLTALVAEQLLKRPVLFEGFDDNMAQLWLWHAVEELEHKSVAFNVYQQVFGTQADSLKQRRRSMRTVSMGFLIGVLSMTTTLMWHDRRHSVWPIKTALLNLRDLASLTALVVRILPDYCAFYRADFHPDQTSHDALIATWQQRLGLLHNRLPH